MSKIIDRFIQITNGKEIDENTCKIIKTHMNHKIIPTEFSECSEDVNNIWMEINNILLSKPNSKYTVKQIKYILRPFNMLKNII